MRGRRPPPRVTPRRSARFVHCPSATRCRPTLRRRAPRSTTRSPAVRGAALLWVSTVLVFALCSWRLDAGGPNRRDQRRHAGEAHTRGAFLFPQMTLDPLVLRQHCDVEAHWHPEFVDYLFLAFTTST